MIILENGGEALLPPNIHSVPTFINKKNYQVVLHEIIQYFEPTMQKNCKCKFR